MNLRKFSQISHICTDENVNCNLHKFLNSDVTKFIQISHIFTDEISQYTKNYCMWLLKRAEDLSQWFQKVTAEAEVWTCLT